MKQICFIPARGGSTRTPGKHTITFNDQNPIELAIQLAHSTKLFDEIHFSSDSDKLLELAMNKNVKIFKRSEEQATGNFPLIELIREHISENNIPSNTGICLFLSTNVLRQKSDILGGYEAFKSNEFKSRVISVCKSERPVELYFSLNQDTNQLENYLGNGFKTTRKQNFKEAFFYNDAFIFDTTSGWLDTSKILFHDGMITYEMPPERSVYIDYPFQAELSKKLLT